MKTRKQPTAKLCDIFLCEDGRTIRSITPGHSTAGAPEREPSIIGAVLPAATKAQARQMVKAHKFLAMTREEQDGAILNALVNGGDWSFSRQPFVSDLARAVLATIYSEAKP